jgi:hypothetical protein
MIDCFALGALAGESVAVAEILGKLGVRETGGQAMILDRKGVGSTLES